MSWLLTHWQDLLVAVSGVVAGSSVILLAVSKLTKNKKDDEVAAWLLKAKGLLERFSLNVRD